MVPQRQRRQHRLARTIYNKNYGNQAGPSSLPVDIAWLAIWRRRREHPINYRNINENRRGSVAWVSSQPANLWFYRAGAHFNCRRGENWLINWPINIWRLSPDEGEAMNLGINIRPWRWRPCLASISNRNVSIPLLILLSVLGWRD